MMEALHNIAVRLAALPAEKQRTFLRQLIAKGMKPAKLPIVAGPRPELIPLSYAQQRLWFLWKLDPASAAYNVPVAVRLSGSIHNTAFLKAFETLVQRHETLRTTFRQHDDFPTQCIHDAGSANVSLIDLSDAPDIEREDRARVLADEEAAAPFDLANGPLFRIKLIRLSPTEHVLLMTMHHIVTDAWSMTVMLGEFARLYDAVIEEHDAGLPPLEIQYADYTLWQRRWLEAGELEKQTAYWKQQLGFEHPALELPFDRPRSATRHHRGAKYTWVLDAQLFKQLHVVASNADVTVFVLLLGALKILLYRYTGNRDLRIGVPIANRTREEAEPLIGFFVSTQVLRTVLDPQESFTSLLRRLKDTVLEAQAHQDVPFEHLVEQLHSSRQTSYNPLFQVMYSHRSRPQNTQYDLKGLRIREFERASVAAQVDLMLGTVEDGDNLQASLTYDRDLFDGSTMERLAEHWTQLLTSIAQAPQSAIGRLRMLTQQGLTTAANRCSGAIRDYGPQQTILELIDAQVARTPDAIAVVFNSEHKLTYAELNTRANRLAHQLRRWNVRTDDRVGICAERSLELVVAILGVMKAGAAYVPLDPQFPRDRLAWMLENAQPSVVITQEHLRHLVVSNPEAAKVWCIDRDWADVLVQPSTSPVNLAHAQSLAYCLYTSGSTGRPKGAGNTHAGLLNRLQWMQEEYPLDASDRVLQKTPYSFDVSVWEFFWPLMTGAGLIVAPPGAHQQPDQLADVIEREGVTTVHFVPSMLQAFIQAGQLQRCERTLRRVICSGEALSPQLQKRFFAATKTVELHNLYGPTEASIDVTYWACRRDADEAGVVPIGRAIANTALHVLGNDLDLRPAGITGELFIAGAGLARGYHGRADLTAERFLPNPYGGQPGERLYRTGDLARARPDGVLEYLGRADHQVKLRGLRIELGEIEARILEYPRVKDAVVIVRDEVLVAYVTPTAASAEDLRAHLRRVLPEYMVPTRYISLDTLPLTSSGKLDRRALPAPEDTGERHSYIAPTTRVENELVKIWTEVLRKESISVSDNFFDLGGHSLLAAQVTSRLSARLEVDVPLRMLFEAADLRVFAQQVEKLLAAADRSQAPPLQRADRTKPIPLSYSQQRLWFLWKLEPASPRYNVATAIRLTGNLDPVALASAFTKLIERHEVLRTTFREQDGEAHQLVRDAQPLVLDRHEPVADVAQWIREQSRKPLDLVTGPILRVSLLQQAEHEHVLLVVLHHIASDGWSMTLAVEEFSQLYKAYRDGSEARLSPLVVQYADYAVWQHHWLNTGGLNQQLTYWRELLRDLPARPDLKGLRANEHAPSARAASHHFVADMETTSQLRAVARAGNATLFSLLLAAFSIVIQERSGQSRFLIGTDVANRNRPEIEPLIGFFVNQLTLAVDLAGTEAARDVVARVQRVVVGALDNQDVPFDRVVEAVRPAREVGRAPLFSIKFINQEREESALGLGDLQLESLPVERAEAELDLTLSVISGGPELLFRVGYRADRLQAESIIQLSQQMLSVLHFFVKDMETPVAHIVANLRELEQQARAQAVSSRNAAMSSMRQIKRRPLASASRLPRDSRDKVTFEQLLPESRLPALCRPATNHVSLEHWAREHRALIEEKIAHHGAILFRDFGISTATEFNACVDAISGAPLRYLNRSSPRSQIDRDLNIYTSTDHPPEEKIFPHNEQSYSAEFPMRLYFYCHIPAPVGGHTPLGDMRRALAQIHPDVREKFLRKKILYLRNYGDGVGLPWQTVFQSTDRRDVEAFCQDAGIEWEWKSGDRLRTRQIGPAIIRHPRTGELSWFNHATFFHVLTLPATMQEALLGAMPENELPQNTFYGDGSPIEPEVIRHLQQVYHSVMVEYPWQRGDVLMIDNILTAHARNAFAGPRKIMTAMAEPRRRRELELDSQE